MIPIDDFKKVQLLTAKVVKVDVHPNADRLYVLGLEVGTEQRQVVSGIRGSYTPEQLLGKTVVLLANLEPKPLRGVDSNGMVLAVKDGEQVRLVTVDGAACPSGLLVT